MLLGVPCDRIISDEKIICRLGFRKVFWQLLRTQDKLQYSYQKPVFIADNLTGVPIRIVSLQVTTCHNLWRKLPG